MLHWHCFTVTLPPTCFIKYSTLGFHHYSSQSLHNRATSHNLGWNQQHILEMERSAGSEEQKGNGVPRHEPKARVGIESFHSPPKRGDHIGKKKRVNSGGKMHSTTGCNDAEKGLSYRTYEMIWRLLCSICTLAPTSFLLFCSEEVNDIKKPEACAQSERQNTNTTGSAQTNGVEGEMLSDVKEYPDYAHLLTWMFPGGL